MRSSGTVLLIDAGSEPMQVLATRIQRLGFRTVRAKTAEEAQKLLGDHRFAFGAAVLPPDLPVPDLRATLRHYRRMTRYGELPFLVAGSRPGPETRRALRAAGAGLAIFEPIDAHALRFQLNRAIASSHPIRRERRSLRAPANWEVPWRRRGRRDEARVYTVSAGGAFLATRAPALRGVDLKLELLIDGQRIKTRATVVMTNVPGNLERPQLPPGMGVRFDPLGDRAAATLELYARARLGRLEL